jgi:hypothetical protein
VEPANLTANQKAEIKQQIIKQFPTLSLFKDDIDFLIEQYNKDKDYVKKLMKSKVPIEDTIKTQFPTEIQNPELIKTVKQGTDEWNTIVDKLEQSKKEFVGIEGASTTIEEISNEEKSEFNVYRNMFQAGTKTRLPSVIYKAQDKIETDKPQPKYYKIVLRSKDANAWSEQCSQQWIT